MNILRQYKENGRLVTEKTKDGHTVSHIIKVQISEHDFEQSTTPPTIEEQILAENQYQTMLLELTTLGGM